MEYQSTRNRSVRLSSAQAIVEGISRDGGLFVPTSIPRVDREFLEKLGKMDYIGRAKEVLALYLTDFTPGELDACVRGAYGEGRFSHPQVAPVVKAGKDGPWMLELWHGPTCAFKDMALQLLPRLMTTAAAKLGDRHTIAVLTATSGDTGKAALEGFRDVPGTKVLVFYPQDGVSPMQKRQMVTQQGENIGVFGIEGNFDAAQSGVKAIFGDRAFAEELEKEGIRLSSANSINWGRLVPQIVYYVSAYCDLVAEGLPMGERVDVAVPTGNFGDILAAYYAREMGVPLGRLICASNRNRVLTDFFQTGRYDRNRPFYTTDSPSMDILISSNLERLLFHLTGGDDQAVAGWMAQLSAQGWYQVPEPLREKAAEIFGAGSCGDEEARATIGRLYREEGYLADPHTAVAASLAGPGTLVVSTASPYKFPACVLEALGQVPAGEDFDQLDQLSRVTGTPVPAPLADLRSREVRFRESCDPAAMLQAVRQGLA